jgi:hypothetical protein
MEAIYYLRAFDAAYRGYNSAVLEISSNRFDRDQQKNQTTTFIYSLCHFQFLRTACLAVVPCQDAGIFQEE